MKMARAMERGGVRLRFTIRSLMIAVAVIAGLLALLTAWSEFLPVLIVVGIPMASSAGLLARVPPHRPRWRFLILTMMLGWIILGCGWLWARSAIWVFQQQEGTVNLQRAARAAEYAFWGLGFPRMTTGLGLVVIVLVLAIDCARQGLFSPAVRGRSMADYKRRIRAFFGSFGVMLLVMGYAFALAFGWFLLFVMLSVGSFPD
jgi:hypothetical protein